jgi:hypothetical protein
MLFGGDKTFGNFLISPNVPQGRSSGSDSAPQHQFLTASCSSTVFSQPTPRLLLRLKSGMSNRVLLSVV